MQELDLEEIESRLYGQVFHSTPEIIENSSSIPTDLIQNVNLTDVPQRHVSNFSISNVIPQKSRYWNVNKPQQVQVVINNDIIPIANGEFEKMKNPTVVNNHVHNCQINNNKDELRKQKRREKRRRKRLAKSQENVNKLQNKTKPNIMNLTSKLNFFVNQNEKNVDNFVEMVPFYALSKFENKSVQNDSKTTVVDIIVLTDSDSDDVQYVEQPEKTVYLVESDTDSSIIIDELEKDKEITQLNQSKDGFDSKFNDVFNKIENIIADQNIATHEEENSGVSSKNISKDNNQQLSPLKQNDENITSTCLKSLTSEVEIACTPDSTNDFIDSDVHTDKQFRFNFGLHGLDLDLIEKETSTNAKVTTADLFETESSCSEQGTPTKKSYSQLQSNAPKDIFQEDDLCSFSNFITPNRDDKKRKSNDVTEQISTKALKLLNKDTDEIKTTPNVSEENSITKKKVPKRYLIVQKNKIITRLQRYELQLKELEENLNIRKMKKKHLKKINTLKKRIVRWVNHLHVNEKKICGDYYKINQENDDNTKIKSKMEHNDSTVNIKVKNVDLEIVPVSNDVADLKIESNLKNDNIKEVSLKSDDCTLKVEEPAVVIVCSDSDNEIVNDSKIDEKHNEKYFVDDSSDYDINDIIEEKDIDSSGFKINNIALNISPVKSNEPSTSAQSLLNENMVENPFCEKNPRKNFSDFWTDDMDEFYDKSWGQENFDINAVIKSMPSDPDKWKIIDDDRNIFKKPNKRKFCLFCRRDGHMMYDCPKLNNKEAIKCSLCGDEGHMRARCPNQMCLTCGNKEGYLTTSCRKCQHYKRIKCTICKMMGHPQNICPDLWRRYHLSINENEKPVVATSKLKPHRDQWCSGCAKPGHLYHECRNIIRDHYQIVPFIVSYNESNNRKNEDEKQRVEPCRTRSQTFENVQSSSSNSGGSPRVDFGKNKPEPLKISYRHRSKYAWIIKKLLQECGNHRPEYFKQLKMLDSELRHNDDFSPHIGTLFRLKNLIRKHRDV